MTIDQQLSALTYCLHSDPPAYEDAAGHLCDLLELCRREIKPTYGKRFGTLTAMAHYYGAGASAPKLVERKDA